MGIITDFLPENYQYKVVKSNYLPKPGPTLIWRLNFFVKAVTNEKECNEWFEQFKTKTNTGWIVARSSFIKTDSKQARFLFGINTKLYIIMRSNTYTFLLQLKIMYACWMQGTKLVKAKEIKNTAFLRIWIKKQTPHVIFAKNPEAAAGFLCHVNFDNLHSHPLATVDVLQKLSPNEETKKAYLIYFNEGRLKLQYYEKHKFS